MRLVIFACLLIAAKATVVEFSQCHDESKCSISEVRINTCKIVKNCSLKKGVNVTISFDFVPKFAASSLSTVVYWESPQGDMAFSEMGSNDGCMYTECPLEPNKPQLFNYGLYLGKKLPSAMYPLKWVLWNTENKEEQCCFKTTITLKKR